MVGSMNNAVHIHHVREFIDDWQDWSCRDLFSMRNPGTSKDCWEKLRYLKVQ
jgi:hypothetical protein